MKLRHHKREHIRRLRRRIQLAPWFARLEALVDREHERVMDECWSAMLDLRETDPPVSTIRPGRRRPSPLFTLGTPRNAPLIGTRPTMVIVDELEELLQDMDPEELARGRAWVAQWAAEDYPGMQVVDITDWIAPDVTQEQLDATFGPHDAEKPPHPGRITGLEVTEEAVLVSIDAPGGAIAGPDDLREPLQ